MERQVSDFVEGAFGDKIHVGDIVVYPGRQSSSLRLNRGKVAEIGYDEVGWSGQTAPYLTVQREVRYSFSKLVRLTNLNNVILYRSK